ncbi:MAG: hypothetical protein NTY38_20935 [Acidobacteria bacterium]|nr:hypothetical protein [Acidobacteriota bacterium]
MDAFRRLGIFSGSFHPPTLAHLGLARAALTLVDEVLFVLPKVLPHKQYEGVSFEDRAALLLAATAPEPRFSLAATEGGLFLEIANECRAAHGPSVELFFLCGRDAAERIVNWDYGPLPPIQQQLETYHLLVADRAGHYTPPPEFAHRIHPLPVEASFDEISSTEVRRRIQAGEPWQHLVPPSIQAEVRRLYTR